MNGKGDTPRPLSVPRKTFEDNWDLAFGQKTKKAPDALFYGIPLYKVEVPLIEEQITALEISPNWQEYKAELYGRYAERFKKDHPELFEDETPFCERSNFDEVLGIMYGSMRRYKEEDNRGLRESDDTSEASGSTIQPPSNT